MKTQARRSPRRPAPTKDAAAVRRLEQQLAEAVERQTATSEILSIIAVSPTDAGPVFDTIASTAMRLLGGTSSAVLLLVGDEIHRGAAATAGSGDYPDLTASMFPMPLAEVQRLRAPGAIAIHERITVAVEDVDTDPRVTDEWRRLVRATGVRSGLVAPMVRGGTVIGIITVNRSEPGAVTDSEKALLQTFANQAVIAIENARLLSELQEKNVALTESHARVTEALQQQTATSEILRVISRSQTDVQPVFDTIMTSAVRLCDGVYAAVLRLIDGVVHMVFDSTVFSADFATGVASTYPRPLRSDRNAGDTAMAERRVIHIPDLEAEHPFESARALARTMGYRGIVFVPMIREGVAIGAIAVARNDTTGFSDKQIQLLQTFADQAVIAIENVRLFTELQASNRELTAALDTQTATSDILRVISRSQTDVQPVFDAILASAVRLLGAYSGALTRIAGEQIELAAHTSTGDTGDAAVRAAFPQPLHSEWPPAQAVRERAPINIADAHTDPRVPETQHALARGRATEAWWRCRSSVTTRRLGPLR